MTAIEPGAPAAPTPSSDPWTLFASWYEGARSFASSRGEMFLATATREGQPSVRTVLLKGIAGGSLRFFTHLDSRKGRELQENPRGALLFYWPALDRQVRIEGGVALLPDTESDAYFASRPRESQLSALVSPQSQPMTREELTARRAAAEVTLAGGPVARPDRWGGFALTPESFEFWVASPARLHERHLYRRTPAGWTYLELAP